MHYGNRGRLWTRIMQWQARQVCPTNTSLQRLPNDGTPSDKPPLAKVVASEGGMVRVR